MRSFRAGEYFGKWLFKRELNTFAELKTAKPYFNHAPNTLKKNSVNYPIKNFLMSKWLTPVVLAAIEDIKKIRKTGIPKSFPSEKLKDLDTAQLILDLQYFGIVNWKDTFVYNLKSKFTFGKFKDNE